MKLRADLFAIGRQPVASKKKKKNVLFMTTFGEKLPVDKDGLYSEVDTFTAWVPAKLADMFRGQYRMDGEVEVSDLGKRLLAFTFNGKRYSIVDNEVDDDDDEAAETGKGKINKV